MRHKTALKSYFVILIDRCRTTGVFETVTARIQSLAATPVGLLEQLLNRVETSQKSTVYGQVFCTFYC